MNRKLSIVAVSIALLFIFSFAVQVPAVRAEGMQDSLMRLDADMTYVNLITTQVGDSGLPLICGLSVYRLDRLIQIDYTVMNVSLYNEYGVRMSSSPAMTEIANGLWIVLFPAVGATGKFEIRATIEWTTDWGTIIEKTTSGYVYLNSWAGLGSSLVSQFSGLTSSIGTFDFSIDGLIRGMNNFAGNMTKYVTDLVTAIQGLHLENIGDPSYDFYYVNIVPFDNNGAMDDFRVALDLLSNIGIDWSMTNVTAMNDLETLIETTNSSSPVLVFSGDVVPMPDDYEGENWTIAIANYLGRNAGTVAFLTDNWTARYFGYSGGVQEDYSDGFYLLTNFTVGLGQPQYAVASAYVSATDVVGDIEDDFNTQVGRRYNTAYKAVDSNFYNFFNGKFMTFRVLYDWWTHPAVYSLANARTKVFVSPFNNMTLNALLLFGEITYGFTQTYSSIMSMLLSREYDSSLPTVDRTWAGDTYDTIFTDWTAKNFTALMLDFAEVAEYQSNKTSEFYSTTLFDTAESIDLVVNATQDEAVNIAENMDIANESICVKVAITDAEFYDGFVPQVVYTPDTMGVATVEPNLGSLGNFENMLGGAFEVAGQTFKGIIGWIKTNILNIDNLNATVCNFIFDGLDVFIEPLEAMGQFYDLAVAIKPYWDILTPVYHDINQWILNGFYSVKASLASVASTISAGLAYVSSMIQQVIGFLVQQLTTLFNNMVNMLVKVSNTMLSLFNSLTVAVGDVLDQVNSNFDAIRNWTLGGLVLVQTSIDGLTSQMQTVFNDLVKGSGFYSQIEGLADVISDAINDNKIVAYILDQIGLNTESFKQFVGVGSKLSDSLNSRDGYTFIVFDSGAYGLALDNITVYGSCNGTVIQGNGTYELLDMDLGTIDSGNITFTDGVGVVDISGQADGVMAIQLSYNSTSVIQYLQKDDDASIWDNAVYGVYTVYVPVSIDAGTSFDVILNMENMRYSSGDAEINLVLKDTNGIPVYVGNAIVSFVGMGNVTKIVTMSVNVPNPLAWCAGLNIGGTYILEISVHDMATGAEWIGSKSEQITVNTLWTAYPLSWWLAGIIIGFAVLGVFLYLLRGVVTNIVSNLKLTNEKKTEKAVIQE